MDIDGPFPDIVDHFHTSNTTVSAFILYIFSTPSLKNDLLVSDLRTNAHEVISALRVKPTGANQSHASTSDLDWAYGVIRGKFKDEVKQLILEGEDWQFGAARATVQKIQDFKLDEMAKRMEAIAPTLWHLLDSLLSATKKSAGHANPEHPTPSNPTDDDEAEYWAQLDNFDLEGIIETITDNESARARRIASRRRAILTIKKVVILSIIMQSTNQKTNALESVIGIFLHSCKTPEKVIEALAHLGISISINAIHSAITSLSAESATHLRELGQTFLVAYAYDNFDVDLKMSVPTAEKSTTTLKHLTSGLVFPLQHGVTKEDMQCSEELWKRSRLNPKANSADLPPLRTWKDLLGLHPEPDLRNNPDALTRREEFFSWKFQQDICCHGPSYFHQFRSEIGLPAAVEQIPLVKTPITPARSMEFSNSTVSGNISTIKNLMEQGGVGDPNDPEIHYEVVDSTLYIILFHGDLGTGDRIFSIQLRRSSEKTPWNRFQFVVFVPGLFHVKMACADAIWRMFIQPPTARQDETALMRDIAQLRPRETGIIASNPGFRRMHQIISHAGICRRLDCWRVEVARRNSTHATLEDFARSKPKFNEIKSIANWLARHYVADFRLERLRRQPAAQRDQQYENALILNKYFLLYEEISHAMNHGDIGRVETCLIPWIFIFRATGKHKYATHMTSFLSNVHFVYGSGLKKAVRYHVLVNPTGKPGEYRGVDWCVELFNLYTKAEHGGGSSNHTVERIIKESPLVQIYRNIRTSIEKNFALTHLTSAHADPDMTTTFRSLEKHIKETSPHKIQPGRITQYNIPDSIDKGRTMLQTGNVPDVEDGSTREGIVDMDDVVGELIDSGDVVS